jgi:prolycopene isomerase
LTPKFSLHILPLEKTDALSIYLKIYRRVDMWQKKPTRREFLKLASMAAASMTIGLMPDKAVSKLVEDGKNPKDYPAVVVGSGMDGLASAVYLSKAGFPVTVIEQHNVPGGYATAFKRGDFNFDVSLHFFGIDEYIYKELGLEGKVERIPLDFTRRIIIRTKILSSPN